MDLRILPSIEHLSQRAAVRALEARYGRDAIVAALREEVAALRTRGARTGTAGAAPDRERGPATRDEAIVLIEQRVAGRLTQVTAPSLRAVINATGVIVHTNLGRAPLPVAAIAAIANAAAGYTNLEYDLGEGRRGDRDLHAERLLCRLTGAEAAVVVNNNAAATLLILAALAAGREVIVSRGELVEIGGGFRVPEVMSQSGAILREVGTTNRTRVADYDAAIGVRTALILRVHRSNFRIEGFTEQPDLGDLVDLGRRRGIPVIEDIGSGYLGLGDVDGAGTVDRLLADEPKVRVSIERGVEVACFSGDKLLGGPQAGIIVGRAAHLARIRHHPLMRAVRVDKLTYAALEATLAEYVAGRAGQTVPVVRMLALDVSQIRARAEGLVSRLSNVSQVAARLLEGVSTVGGGAAPGLEIPTMLVVLECAGLSPDRVDARLRAHVPPVIGRIERDRFLLDLRTVLPAQDDVLVEAITAAVSHVEEAEPDGPAQDRYQDP